MKRTHLYRWLAGSIAAILLLFAAGWFFFEVTTVTIHNRSAVPLTNVKCMLNGRGYCPTHVAAGGSRTAFVILRSEDPMVFSFHAAGSQKQVMFGYPSVEPAEGYEIDVAPDLTVTKKTNYRF